MGDLRESRSSDDLNILEILPTVVAVTFSVGAAFLGLFTYRLKQQIAQVTNERECYDEEAQQLRDECRELKRETELIRETKQLTQESQQLRDESQKIRIETELLVQESQQLKDESQKIIGETKLLVQESQGLREEMQAQLSRLTENSITAGIWHGVRRVGEQAFGFFNRNNRSVLQDLNNDRRPFRNLSNIPR